MISRNMVESVSAPVSKTAILKHWPETWRCESFINGASRLERRFYRESLFPQAMTDLLESDMLTGSLSDLDRTWASMVECPALFPSAQKRVRIANSIHAILHGGILRNKRKIKPEDWIHIGEVVGQTE